MKITIDLPEHIGKHLGVMASKVGGTSTRETVAAALVVEKVAPLVPCDFDVEECQPDD